jgi:hypothetical protein
MTLVFQEQKKSEKQKSDRQWDSGFLVKELMLKKRTENNILNTFKAINYS